MQAMSPWGQEGQRWPRLAVGVPQGLGGARGPTGAADVPEGDAEGEVGLVGLALGLEQVVAGGAS